MSEENPIVSQETQRLHALVRNGSLEELRWALQQAGDSVNVPGRLGVNALMEAIMIKDLEKMKLLIEFGADPERTDDFNSTALLHAVTCNFVEGVRYLLSLNVNLGYRPKYPLKKIHFGNLLNLPGLTDNFSEEAQKGFRHNLEFIDEANQELDEALPHLPIITHVGSVEVLQLFIEAGDDWNRAPNDVKRALMGLETGGTLRVSLAEYQANKSPRFGTLNPERMDVPFWKEMIRTGGNTYVARETFNETSPFTHPGPVWCFNRFGSTITPLKDGRFVQVGGEHEDYYDPDFCIYNDVVIHDGRGGSQIYGYARDQFPPTDFHSATLCGDGIFLIGCLGYSDSRVHGFTPVYRLQLESWRIESVPTTGEMPGWISNHRARHDPQRNIISIDGGEIYGVDAEGNETSISNEERFELDLSELCWRKCI